jgi:hypothetical protein
LTRKFINTALFDKRWAELKLTDNDLLGFQNFLLQTPKAGDVIE